MSENETPAWAKKGYEGAKQEEARLEAQYGPRRFWVPVTKDPDDPKIE